MSYHPDHDHVNVTASSMAVTRARIDQYRCGLVAIDALAMQAITAQLGIDRYRSSMSTTVIVNGTILLQLVA